MEYFKEECSFWKDNGSNDCSHMDKECIYYKKSLSVCCYECFKGKDTFRQIDGSYDCQIICSGLSRSQYFEKSILLI